MAGVADKLRMWASSFVLLAACTTRGPEQAKTNLVSPAVHTAAPQSDPELIAAALQARIETAVRVWNDSCPSPNAYGMCLSFEDQEPDVGPCGAALLGTPVLHVRDVESAARAQAELADALSLAGCESTVGCRRETLRVEPKDPETRRAFLRVLALGRLAKVDAQLETYLSAPAPVEQEQEPPGERTRDKAVSQRVDARVDAFLQLYGELVALKEYPDAELIQRAALRSSWAALHLHDEVRNGLGPHEDCEESAERMKRLSRNTAAFCVTRADESGSASPASQACRELLTRLSP